MPDSEDTRLVKFKFPINNKEEDYIGCYLINKENSVYAGLCEIQGLRTAQEDVLRVIADQNIAAFSQLSQEAQSVVLHSTFQNLQDTYGKVAKVGSTACIATVWQDKNTIHTVTANLGDSTAFLVILNSQGEIKTFKRLNRLHKPTDPIERCFIERNGGYVSDKNGRLNACLSLSGAFGDTDQDGIRRIPDIIFHQFTLAEDCQAFLISACDGLEERPSYEYYFLDEEEQIKNSEYDIAQCIQKYFKSTPDHIAEQLVRRVRKQSGDNISVVVAPVSATPVSAAVFDGHGHSDQYPGNKVSKALGEHFYPVLKNQMQALFNENNEIDKQKLAQKKESLTQQPSFKLLEQIKKIHTIQSDIFTLSNPRIYIAKCKKRFDNNVGFTLNSNLPEFNRDVKNIAEKYPELEWTFNNFINKYTYYCYINFPIEKTFLPLETLDAFSRDLQQCIEFHSSKAEKKSSQSSPMLFSSSTKNTNSAFFSKKDPDNCFILITEYRYDQDTIGSFLISDRLKFYLKEACDVFSTYEEFQHKTRDWSPFPYPICLLKVTLSKSGVEKHIKSGEINNIIRSIQQVHPIIKNQSVSHTEHLQRFPTLNVCYDDSENSFKASAEENHSLTETSPDKLRKAVFCVSF